MKTGGIFFSTLFTLCILLVSCASRQSGEPEIQKSSYTEQYRPQFHFSPDSMWMNDPNGMVYYEGEYHLF